MQPPRLSLEPITLETATPESAEIQEPTSSASILKSSTSAPSSVQKSVPITAVEPRTTIRKKKKQQTTPPSSTVANFDDLAFYGVKALMPRQPTNVNLCGKFPFLLIGCLMPLVDLASDIGTAGKRSTTFTQNKIIQVG